MGAAVEGPASNRSTAASSGGVEESSERGSRGFLHRILDGSGNCWDIAGLDLGAGSRQLDSAGSAPTGHDGKTEASGEGHLGRIAFAPSWREDQVDTRQALALLRGRQPQLQIDQPGGGLRPLSLTNQEGGARDHPRCLERLEDSVASRGRAGQQDVGSGAVMEDVPVGREADALFGRRQDRDPLRADAARAPLLFGKPATHDDQIGEHSLGFLERNHGRRGTVPAEQVAVRPAARGTVEMRRAVRASRVNPLPASGAVP